MNRFLRIKKYLFFLCLPFFPLIVHAQFYPTQSSLSIQGPYTPYLRDYVEGDKIAFSVMLSDPALSFLDVKLQIVLKGVGVEIRTNPSNSFSPIHLTYGTPVVFTSADLSDYFLSSNLVFKGMSVKDYEQKGILPEGLYELKIEVLEASRNKLMGSASTTFWAMLQDPPLLNFPVANAQLEANTPASILFQWQAMHKVYSGFDVEYGLELYEVRTNDSRPINEVVRTSIPIFQTTTTQTSYTYGPTDPVLQPGLHYLWRVQAKTLNNKNEVFKNNGYSQVYAFDWLPICKPPTNLLVKTNPQGMAYVTFDAGEGAISYKVRIRAVQSSSEWIELESLTPSVLINQLALNRLYEVQVSSQCDKRISVYSPSTTFTISSSSSEPKSKDPLPVLKLDPTTYLDPLDAVPGTSIKVNYYTMQVKTISYDPVTKLYSGTGKVYHPEFGIWISTTFSNIQINAEKVFVKGLIAMVAKKPTNAELAQVPNRKQPLLCVVEESSSSQANGNVGGNNSTGTGNTNRGTNTSNNGSATAGTGSTNNGGNTTASSQTNKNDSTQVGTNNTNSPNVQAGSNNTLPTGPGTNPVPVTSIFKKEQTNVEFKEGKNQQYGFDENTISAYEGQYLKIELDGQKNYEVSHKSIQSGLPDPILAEIYVAKKDTSIKTIYFISGTKTHNYNNGSYLMDLKSGITPITVLNQKYTVTTRGSTIEQTETLQGAMDAYTPITLEARANDEKGKRLGISVISTYNEIKYKLKFIAVYRKDRKNIITPTDIRQKAGLDEIESALNTIYKQAVVHWIVDKKIDTIQVNYDQDFDGLIDFTDKMEYTLEQKEIIKQFKQRKIFDDKVKYLFIVDDAKSLNPSGVYGMMKEDEPGFIVGSQIQSKDKLIWTIAHELGHGLGLTHPNEGYANYHINPFGGDDHNLMYDPEGSGKKLRKYQWDILNNRETYGKSKR